MRSICKIHICEVSANMNFDRELFTRMRVSLFDLIKLYYLTRTMSQFKGFFVHIYIFLPISITHRLYIFKKSFFICSGMDVRHGTQ